MLVIIGMSLIMDFHKAKHAKSHRFSLSGDEGLMYTGDCIYNYPYFSASAYI